MTRPRRFVYFLSAIAIGGCVCLIAQTPQSAPSDHAPSGPGKVVPAPALVPSNSPFAIDRANTKLERSIRMLPEEQMSRKDRDLLANAESSIKERAGIENLDFNGSGWSYEELACPALANHLFLRFTRADRTPQMSKFSVAIPRNGNGRMHLIPIVRKGYSLFSPAPVGPVTIAVFNRIREEEGAGIKADWLGTGLCYAAMAGANPQLGDTARQEGELVAATMPPTLSITPEGGATIRFADVSSATKPMEWTMVFDPHGKLLKANYDAAYMPIGVKGAAAKE